MAANDFESVLHLSLKWSIILISLINIIYAIYIFALYIRDSGRERSLRLIVWTVVGVLIFMVGLYGAAQEISAWLIIFAIVLVLNLVFGFFQTELYRGSVALYALVIVLTVIFAYLVHKKGR